MQLYTIGFTKKSAETFFGLLRDNGVQRLVDITPAPRRQLAGFAKSDDLAVFPERACGLRLHPHARAGPQRRILYSVSQGPQWPATCHASRR